MFQSTPTIQPGRIVTFSVGAEIYGAEIFKVREVLTWASLIREADLPDFVEGLFPFRDGLVPVVDLGLRLRVKMEAEQKRRILILQCGDRLIGAVSGDISKVHLVGASSFEPVPELLCESKNLGCVTHLVKVEEGLILLLDPNRLLTANELRDLNLWEEDREKRELDDRNGKGRIGTN